ncbi:DNA-binding response OmpR family regulator [Janthinobacterium sp. CG_23.3]|uniref:response regulator transcription factor n=1 Tax=unclassified Janthinobacterium TaxID=2610881 RepID=UPI00034891BF|nr:MULTISPECIES: response regulator transcription factor [unclassified Janthinobacterium]MEC5161228.1 two-component system response regulator TctD [Janthinobacterium sp. CG_S6]
MNILLVEDDLDMSNALLRALERRGFSVATCFDGGSALRSIKEGQHDLVILDLNIPVIDGMHLLQRIRAQGITTPVIVLTARGAVGDRVAGLNAGADDYLAKPFDLQELDARVRALLRRKNGGEETVQRCGELSFKRSSDTFYHGGEPLMFPPREFALLKALIAMPGHALTKEKLFRLVFSFEEDVQLEAIEVIIHRLRKKLAGTRTEILTLRGVGYLLRACATASRQ